MNENTEIYLSSLLFANREKEFKYAPFDREMAFYSSICAGDMELVKQYAAPLFSEGCGTLSKDPLRNIKYHFVVSTSLIARFCVNSGMTPEEAYSLSDVYIMKADECRSIEEVRAVHYEMIEGYTNKMRCLRSRKVYSKQIVCAIDFISEHLHGRIKIRDVADHLHINPEYLSRLFKSETGVTFTEYVSRKKIDEAANLLRYSEYTDLEVSSLFSFSSQSYFIKVFTRYKGMTPGEYKRKYRMM